MSFLNRIRRWFSDAFRPPLLGASVEDLPDVLEANTVYLVGDLGEPWSAALICPCGCGEAIRLSLIKNDRPRWKATQQPDGAVTLHPSVWRTKGCESHFILRNGRIIWAKSLTRGRSSGRLGAS